jgi:hypothetical protein
MKLNAITLDMPTLAQPVTDIYAVATLRGTTVDVDELRARVGNSQYAGTLQLAAEERPTLRFELETQRADLGELLGLMAGEEETATAEAARPDPDSFLVRGVADGSLKVAEGSWANLRFHQLDAHLQLAGGIATLDPVSMELYDGRFGGRLASNLRQEPPSFEFSGEVEDVDMDGFLSDQIGMSNILFGQVTGRVAGQGAGTDPVNVVRSLEGEGVALITEGQIGRLDVLRSVGQVAGVLGQRTLANLATTSATGATRFSQLAGDFRMHGGRLRFDRLLLQSQAFDLSGTGNVDLLSNVINGAFQIQFSPEVSTWMRQEGSRAAELFWDSRSGRVILPLGLSGPLGGVGASVDWSAAADAVVHRTVERELTKLLGNALGGSRTDSPDPSAAPLAAPPEQGRPAAQTRARRAESPSGRFAIEVTRTRWGGSFFAQDYKIECTISGSGIQRVDLRAVDAGGRELEKRTVDVAAKMAGSLETTVQLRVDGKPLLLATFPVTVTLTAMGDNGENAELELEIAAAGR